MSLIVQKFGGSPVAAAESIKRVAKRIVETRKAGKRRRRCGSYKMGYPWRTK